MRHNANGCLHGSSFDRHTRINGDHIVSIDVPDDGWWTNSGVTKFLTPYGESRVIYGGGFSQGVPEDLFDRACVLEKCGTDHSVGNVDLSIKELNFVVLILGRDSLHALKEECCLRGIVLPWVWNISRVVIIHGKCVSITS